MNTEQILEFHEIKRKLIEFAHTEHAKQKIQELTPYLSQAKAKAALRDTTEGMGIAVAILEELRRSQALFLVTTHYPETLIPACAWGSRGKLCLPYCTTAWNAKENAGTCPKSSLSSGASGRKAGSMSAR